MGKEKTALKLKEIGEGLIGSNRKEYWRSLDQLAQTDEFKKWVEDEFPERSSLLNLDRRQFVKLMGASMLMASLAGCRRLPQEQIVSYAITPEGQVPGINNWYASMVTIGGYAFGTVVESRQGRPGKIEGHPAHPATLGKSSVWMQAALYDMYDPDRSQSVLHDNEVVAWEDFVRAKTAALGKSGVRVRILTGTTTSPTVNRLVNELVAKYPGAAWHQWDAFNEDNEHAGMQMAFGQPVQPVYNLRNADVIVSLDSDFLGRGPGQIRYANDFARGRYLANPNEASMNRLYVVHSEANITSANADNRLAVKPSRVEAIARALLSGGSAGLEGEEAKFVDAMVADLNAHTGRVAVFAGQHQPPAVHAIAAALNSRLGSVGQAVNYVPKITYGSTNQAESLQNLLAAINADSVDALFIFGTNPVLTAPRNWNVAEALAKVDFSVHHGLHHDETGQACKWHLPEAHALESWGDGRSFDGTVTLQQPLIAPLYQGRSSIEVLDLILGRGRNGRQLIGETALGANATEAKINEIVHNGFIEGTPQPVAVSLSPNLGNEPAASTGGELELLVLPDPNIGDGRYANNAWLQELPKPMSSLTWDNTIDLNPETAKELGLAFENMAELTVGGKTVKGIVNTVPGQAKGTVVVYAGYGRDTGGTIATGLSRSMPELAHPMNEAGIEMGFDAYPIYQVGAFGVPVEIRKVGGRGYLAAVQTHHSMEGRDIVRSGSLEEFKKNPGMLPEHPHHVDKEASLYNQTAIDNVGQHKWGMTIDLSLCIGCNACTIACQAENNIPTVGKEQVMRGREMHWIRVDRYNVGPADSPSETVFQPVPCMHCEKAPCEPVCPVAATVHSKEGLNQMVYNRCVGTRYCSNNCPYKVRRFNFLNYADKVDKPTLTLLNNPDVTVRGRGVMEKCTYCVQRINHARIDSKKSGEPIRDGQIQTACQQACPTNAIVFGDLADKDSQVSKQTRNPRNYLLLEELNTTPRTTYLARVANPNPALVEAAPAAHGEGAH
jgi:MoCo/4Fe-4S cofactor protein with predicted Tat translocation signal